MSEETYVVICRDDAKDDQPGPYVLATRQTFASLAAAQNWARAIAPAREAIVVRGRWHQLLLTPRHRPETSESELSRAPQPRRNPRFPSAYRWK